MVSKRGCRRMYERSCWRNYVMDKWWSSEWYVIWLRLARESNARSPKRVDEWIVFFNEREELVYKYVRYDRLAG